ncbi:MAG: hypothetical protein GKR88_11315 [Flavobacteriaceae bacterium]|nr:MAG: hypothetical protein GKR88_11315 [Flavobacteriaceae bacterium]
MRDRDINREFDMREMEFEYKLLTTLENSIQRMEMKAKSMSKEIHKLKKRKKKGKELKEYISKKLDSAVNISWQIIREKKLAIETLESELKALRLKTEFVLQEEKGLKTQITEFSAELEQEFLKSQNLKNKKKE